MSVDMARRLLESGLIPRAEVELALLEAMIRGTSLVQALLLHDNEWTELVEQELARTSAPFIRRVQARVELCAQLPVGMCERLLAVPVRQESITKTVDVAAVDPFDSHIQQEFAFHLDAPVRVLRAGLGDVLSALDGLHAGGAFTQSMHEMLGVPTPTLGSDPPGFPETEARTSASQRPIPLVRRSREPRVRPSTRPGAREPEAAPNVALEAAAEPIIDLTREKPENSEAVTRSSLREADLVQVEKQLHESVSPDEVVELCAEHGCPEGSTIVFGVKASEFAARAASFDVVGLRDVTIPKSRPNVLGAAVEAGHYLGKLPETLTHALLRDLLAERLGPEVCSVPVLVSGRATLMILITGFERSYAATQRLDRLARAAGEALERLVIERKRTQKTP